MYLSLKSIHVKRSLLVYIGAISYVTLPIKYRSIIGAENTEDNFCTVWCFLAPLRPAETNVSLTFN